jgi:hypothetical protein
MPSSVHNPCRLIFAEAARTKYKRVRSALATQVETLRAGPGHNSVLFCYSFLLI